MDYKEIIQQEKKDRSGSLELTFMNLKEIPKEVFELKYLEALYLNGNEIEEVPDDIAQLKQLTVLSLQTNRINKISPKISELSALINLALFDNSLKELPENFGDFSSLQQLHLSGNEFEEIPNEIFRISELFHLCLDDNLIKKIPEEIAQLEKLEELIIRRNKITELPENALIKLVGFNLGVLDLFGNPLEEPWNSISGQSGVGLLKHFAQLKRGFIYKVPIQSEIRTAIKQYLLYFSEFVKVKYQEEFNIEVSSEKDSVLIETTITDEEKLQLFESRIAEYVGFIKEKVDDLNPYESSSKMNQLALIELKTQVKQLQMQLEIRNFKVQVLEEVIDQKKLISSPPKIEVHQSFSPEIHQISHFDSHQNIEIELKDLEKHFSKLKELLIKEEPTSQEYLDELSESIRESLKETKPSKSLLKRLHQFLSKGSNQATKIGGAIDKIEGGYGFLKKIARKFSKLKAAMGLDDIDILF